MQNQLEPLPYMDVPDTNDPMRTQIAVAIQIEVGKLVEPTAMTDHPDIKSSTEQREDVDPPELGEIAKTQINNGYCKIFAERVHKRLGEPDVVTIESDEHRHTWLAYDGLVYDSETPCGVHHPSLLPVYNRGQLHATINPAENHD